MQGGWATAGRARAYMMATIRHSANVANTIDDPKIITMKWLKHAFQVGNSAVGELG